MLHQGRQKIEDRSRLSAIEYLDFATYKKTTQNNDKREPGAGCVVVWSRVKLVKRRSTGKQGRSALVDAWWWSVFQGAEDVHQKRSTSQPCCGRLQGQGVQMSMIGARYPGFAAPQMLSTAPVVGQTPQPLQNSAIEGGEFLTARLDSGVVGSKGEVKETEDTSRA